MTDRFKITANCQTTSKDISVMELEFLSVTLLNLGINFIYTFVALIVSIAALILIDKKFLPNISIEEEMKKGNIAVAIFASTILLFVAIIVTFGFKG
jgi:hypothetical protein